MRIGQVTTVARPSRPARLHLDLHGLAYCGAGNGRIVPATSREIEDTMDALIAEAANRICRRCAAAIQHRLTFKVAAAAASRLTGAQLVVARLTHLADLLDTPAQQAANRALAESIARTIAQAATEPAPARHAVRAGRPARPARPLSGWGQLRAAHQRGMART